MFCVGSTIKIANKNIQKRTLASSIDILSRKYAQTLQHDASPIAMASRPQGTAFGTLPR